VDFLPSLTIFAENASVESFTAKESGAFRESICIKARKLSENHFLLERQSPFYYFLLGFRQKKNSIIDRLPFHYTSVK
jgi:hypothetical protein